MMDKHAALVYTMVMMSAADGNMSDAELKRISLMVKFLPSFRDFDLDALPQITTACTEILQKEDGIDVALESIKQTLSPRLRETAYAVACDVAAADGETKQEELRLLEIMRHTLEIERLVAAAIERGARARLATE
ncbi:MAG: tellurite resistance TerB family protein [Alphaproteobacteria bacterium]|nr:tellurite resistance TerB family protein [Alphaproteobacteria bacterium]